MDFICIRCPIGCPLHVGIKDGKVISVTGNTCARGADYARAEAIAPVRTVTGSVRVKGGLRPVVSVKTVPEVPKESIFPVVSAMRSYRGIAPIRAGDVLIENIAQTGSNLIATSDVESK